MPHINIKHFPREFTDEERTQLSNAITGSAKALAPSRASAKVSALVGAERWRSENRVVFP
jgi:hypothetical protein